jgi:hypothetical protein
VTAVDPVPAVELPAPIVLPQPRGPRSEHLLAHLQRPAHDLGALPDGDDALDGEDTPLALHVLYELHYRGYDDVDERWEWEPALLRERRRLEHELEARLVDEAGPAPVGVTVDDIVTELDRLAGGSDDKPSLSAWVVERGSGRHLREFAVHRSIYQLREADAHTFGIPRLHGPAKAALVEIQRGEYGDGEPAQVHARLFADAMRALDLDPSYGAYLDVVPGPTLSTVNLVDLFGLHRRWRGALVGHLALFEMASVGPMGRYAAAVRKAGFGERAARFYDAHVLADQHHQVVGRDLLAAGLARDEPLLGGEIVFGARALDVVEGRMARRLVAAWERGETSLLAPLPH